MTYDYIFDPKAAIEYFESVDWYWQHSALAATGFVAEVNRILSGICSNPKQYRTIQLQLREAILRKYPFTIVFKIDESKGLIIVESVFHQSRDPQTKFEA